MHEARDGLGGFFNRAAFRVGVGCGLGIAVVHLDH